MRGSLMLMCWCLCNTLRRTTRWLSKVNINPVGQSRSGLFVALQTQHSNKKKHWTHVRLVSCAFLFDEFDECVSVFVCFCFHLVIILWFWHAQTLGWSVWMDGWCMQNNSHYGCGSICYIRTRNCILQAGANHLHSSVRFNPRVRFGGRPKIRGGAQTTHVGQIHDNVGQYQRSSVSEQSNRLLKIAMTSEKYHQPLN